MNRLSTGDRSCAGVLAVWALLQFIPLRDAHAATPGVVLDNETGKAILFDADTDTITGSVALGPNIFGSGDCVILGDRGPAFATDFGFRLWSLDTAAAPPRLGPSPNPIRISTPGEDIALGPDARYLVVCDGNGAAPVSVVDVASGREVSTFPLGTDCNSVDVCPNGSVLVTSSVSGVVRRLTLDAAGHLADTGESLSVSTPMNVYCSSTSGTGLVVTSFPGAVQSFVTSGMIPVDTRTLPLYGLSAVFSPDGGRIYVRDGDSVLAYGFDPATGHLDDGPTFDFFVGGTGGYFGMEQLAIDPAGSKLYVPQYGSLGIYDASSGAPIATLTHPDLVRPTGICLPPQVDRDDDGLSDAREEILGTDPQNEDTDGDGLLDGFEASHGFDPLLPVESAQDPDADGLTNLAEQAAGTDPRHADTDGDGLPDGLELLTLLTDPRNPDTDGDGLMDGAEVETWLTDPRNPDSDGGGVQDGNEVQRDDTNPRDPADDRRAGLGMVVDNRTQRAVIFDRDTFSTVGSPDVLSYGSAAGDCLITPDGGTGFFTNFGWEVTAIDLHASPPDLAPPPNPIYISNPGEDLAITPDGRFLVVCDGNGLLPVSVVDVATRTEVDTLSLGSDCDSVEVCPDGTVLVTSFQANAVIRLSLSDAGILSDPGDRLSVPQPVNVLCAPDSHTGLVVSHTSAQGLTSFTLPHLAAVDTRALPEAPIAAVLTPLGDAVYVRHSASDSGGIEAFQYDPATGHLGADPFLRIFVANTNRFFGMEQLAIDPEARQLFVSEAGELSVFDAATGARLTSMMDLGAGQPTGVCLHYADTDHDGLIDALERRFGTDPANPDSDGDGLLDGYEVLHGLNPLLGADGTADPDGDGLDNLAEQSARTDPRNPDTDRDGLNDGQEVLTFHTDPRNPDTDGDDLADGTEVTVQHTNPLNPDTDGGGVRDGNEINRDGTDPLDPADDRPSGPGITIDYSNSRIVVFDSESEGVLASLETGSDYGQLGACVISNDGRTAYVADLDSKVWVTDVDVTPPRFSATGNPISLAGPASRLALTADGRFLITCGSLGYGAGATGALEVIDTATRAVVDTFSTFSCDAVDVCPDGSVLVSSNSAGLVRRLALGAAGTMTDTGEWMNLDRPRELRCARDGRTGVVLTDRGYLDSFLIAGLARVDRRPLPVTGGQSVVFTPMSDRVIVRGQGGGKVFGYDAATAHLSADPIVAFPTLPNGSGVAVDRSGNRLFSAEGSVVRVYDVATGAVVGTVKNPDIEDASQICLRRYDRDSDGLPDDEEIARGADPGNPDTDGDGLKDGFEVAHGLDPRFAGDAMGDPDGDGLNNLAEQAAGTDPGQADTDGDGLSDGAEILTWHTDPRRADSDADGLADGTEVALHGTNPANPDTDSGGVEDGNEVNRDGTNPLLNSDDRPSTPGIVLDPIDQSALVFSPDRNAVLGPVNLSSHTGLGDCAVSNDGRTAFVRSGKDLLAVDLSSTPPALAPQPMQNWLSSIEAIALSPDGRYLVACGQQFGQMGLSVVDTATRQQVSTLTLPLPDCLTVDVCDDGSVLAAPGGFSTPLTRLRLDASGALHNTQESLPIGLPQHVSCAPGGEYGAVFDILNHMQLFRLAGMEPIDARTLPSRGVGAAWRPTGNHATLFVRLDGGGEANGVMAFDFDLRTGVLGPDPFLTIAAPGGNILFYTRQIALDPTGTELYLATLDGLDVYSADTGNFLKALPHADPLRAQAVCLPPAGDRDRDGLKDDEERRLGTDPDRPDTDGDGMPDGFEVRYDLDPRSPGDAHQDADGDGLDNLGELAAGTNPRNPDTDGDGLSDGAEVLLFHTNPLASDTDNDGLPDGQDNCPATYNPDQRDQARPGGPGDACEDPDHDGVPDLLDDCLDTFNPDQSNLDRDGLGDACDPCPVDVLNDHDGDGLCESVDDCPVVANPQQTDADHDGLGDACDICPAVSDASQSESVACIATTDDGGSCLETRIDLIGQHVAGTIGVFPVDGGLPDSLRFEVLDSACDAGDVFTFELNGISLGSFGADPTLSCDCQVAPQQFDIADPALIGTAWHVARENRFVIRKTGGGAAVAWVRAIAARNGVDHSACLFDAGANNCTGTDICGNGFVFALPEAQANIPDIVSTAGPAVIEQPFADSVLPTRIDLTPLRDGAGLICITAQSTDGDPQKDCHAFTKQGERNLAINGAACGDSPVATITTAPGSVECQSPAGAAVTLDGSASTDPDSSPGTHDDIAAFDWFEDFGLPGQVALGSGEVLHSTLALGNHAITLRVTDRSGRSGTASVQIDVVDTVPPAIQMSVTPAMLWPPSHQMVKVAAAVTATDACGAPAVILVAVTSSEPDDAPGGSDGNTVDDIQGAAIGTADFGFALRAERISSGSGRTYVVTYLATDGSGHTATATAQVSVPHDRSGSIDPIDVRARQKPGGTVLDWTDAGGSDFYSVIRGSLSAMRETPTTIDTGPVVCIASHILAPTTDGREDAENPPIGGGYFYLVEFSLAGDGTYGSPTASKPLVPGAGACP